MTLRQVVTRIYTGGGGGPGISDTIALYARVNLSDTITTTASDVISTLIKASYAETNAGQSESLGLYAKVDAVDTAPAQSDFLSALALTGYESNPAPADVLNALSLRTGTELNALPTETIKTGFTGFAETSPGAIDARPTTTVHTYAASQSSSGGGTTNGANAIGAPNGTVATVTGSGLGGANTLTLTIPVASVPTNGAKTLRCYIAFTAALATATVTYTNTGGSPASGTVPVANGATIAASTDVVITTVGTSFTVQVLVNAGGILAPSFSVDAVEIQTVSVI